jgi:type II secretory pathway pseudopilin PulG
MPHRDQQGMSLVEICLALVVLGLVVSSLLAALATSSTASKHHRDLTTADALLRDYAEAAKDAVRSCPDSGTFTVTPPSAPSSFTVTSLGAQTCPATNSTSTLHLTVTLPSGTVKDLDVAVRTP